VWKKKTCPYYILHLCAVIMLLLCLPEAHPKCHIQVVSTSVLYSKGSRFNSQSVDQLYSLRCMVLP
jgi:hypothetical protein